MTTEGWIFMVGLRVFDVGGLIVWLVWFFRLRDNGADEPEDGGEDYRYRWGREPEEPEPPTGPPDLVVPKPDAEPWPTRRRDHGGDRAPATLPSRPFAPHRVPDRVPERRERV